MKKLLILLAMLLPMAAHSMKVEKDEIDEFTGLRTVITSWESLCKTEVHIRFRLQNNIEWLDFKFRSNSAIVIAEGEKLMLKSTSDSIATFKSCAIFHGGIGDGSVGLNGSGVWGIFASYTGNLSWFNNNVVRLLRVYATDCYYDREVNPSDGKKLCNLYSLFSETVSQKYVKRNFETYDVQFVKRSSKSSSWDVVKEETFKDVTKDELQAVIDAWKGQTSEATIYDCIIKKHKKK